MTVYRIFAAALLLGTVLFSGIASGTAPAFAQGYSGVMSSDDGGEQASGASALPYGGVQQAEGGGHAGVTGGGDTEGDTAGGAAQGGFEMNSDGLEATAEAENEPSEFDITDIYGHRSNAAMSQQPTGDGGGSAPSGFMAAFGSDGKPPNELDPGNDPVPADMYSAMGKTTKDQNELRRERIQRAVAGAEARQKKEIDDMNKARMYENQVKMQEEMDRIRETQEDGQQQAQDTQDAYEDLTGSADDGGNEAGDESGTADDGSAGE